jgi:hypothetical protein
MPPCQPLAAPNSFWITFDLAAMTVGYHSKVRMPGCFMRYFQPSILVDDANSGLKAAGGVQSMCLINFRFLLRTSSANSSK